MELRTIEWLFLTLLSFECVLNVHRAEGSVASLLPIGPTYTVATPGIITAHSHQVIARNFNRFYVPTTAVYPVNRGYDYGYPYLSYPTYGYDYGYNYGYYGYYR